MRGIRTSYALIWLAVTPAIVNPAQTGVDPIETLYVGDMAADHEAAKRAGVDYAHAEWGYGQAPADDCWILPDMQDLLELIPTQKNREAS